MTAEDEGHEEEEREIMSPSGSSWQRQLDLTLSLLDFKLRDLKELADKHHEVSEDYDTAMGSWQIAKRDIGHFMGVWTAKSRKWRNDQTGLTSD